MTKNLRGKYINCVYCKKEFYIPKNRFEKAKYCSKLCKHRSCTLQITRNCAVCNKLFTHISSRANKAKYCSRLCYHRAQKGRGSREFECANCGIKFMGSPSKRYKFCTPKCRGNYKRAPETYAHFTNVRKALKTRGLIKACEKCGYSACEDILGIHHKDGNRKNNARNNLMIVCPNCHSLIHRQHIPH